MSRNSTMDLTTGHPLKQLLFFSLPLVAGTLFQQFYSFADTVMVGRFLGESALAAVGTTYSLHFLTLGFVLGACAGFGIPLAQLWAQRIATNSGAISGTASGCAACSASLLPH